MDIKIIDAHTHVQMMDPAQQSAVISRAVDMGIGMINAGADEQSSRDAVELAHRYEYVWATIGHHPHEVDKNPNLLFLKELAQDEKVVGIGECGLDYAHFARPKKGQTKEKEIALNSVEYTAANIEREKKIQEKLFRAHIQIAYETKKPLVIHCREAFTDTIRILRENKEKLLPQAGILHFFTGTSEDANNLLELGFSCTFGGLITFNRSFDEIIASIPNDRILAETDAPWVAPLSRRGHVNEPSYIPEVIAWLAKIKGISQEKMEKIILENTRSLFRL